MNIRTLLVLVLWALLSSLPLRAAVIDDSAAARQTFAAQPGALALALPQDAGDSAAIALFELDRTEITTAMLQRDALLLDRNYRRLQAGDISAWVALPLGPNDGQALMLLSLAGLIFVLVAAHKLYKLTR